MLFDRFDGVKLLFAKYAIIFIIVIRFDDSYIVFRFHTPIC